MDIAESNEGLSYSEFVEGLQGDIYATDSEMFTESPESDSEIVFESPRSSSPIIEPSIARDYFPTREPSPFQESYSTREIDRDIGTASHDAMSTTPPEDSKLEESILQNSRIDSADWENSENISLTDVSLMVECSSSISSRSISIRTDDIAFCDDFDIPWLALDLESRTYETDQEMNLLPARTDSPLQKSDVFMPVMTAGKITQAENSIADIGVCNISNDELLNGTTSRSNLPEVSAVHHSNKTDISEETGEDDRLIKKTLHTIKEHEVAKAAYNILWSNRDGDNRDVALDFYNQDTALTSHDQRDNVSGFSSETSLIVHAIDCDSGSYTSTVHEDSIMTDKTNTSHTNSLFDIYGEDTKEVDILDPCVVQKRFGHNSDLIIDDNATIQVDQHRCGNARIEAASFDVQLLLNETLNGRSSKCDKNSNISHGKSHLCVILGVVM